MNNVAQFAIDMDRRFPGLKLLETQCIVHEVPGVFAANQIVKGTLNPDAPEVGDVSLSPEASAKAMVERYGKGFGAPWRLDPNVAPAISKVPDADAAWQGWLFSHNTPELPNGGPAWANYPLAAQFAWSGDPSPVFNRLTATAEADLRALVNLQQKVIQPLNQGLGIGAVVQTGGGGGVTSTGAPQQPPPSVQQPPPSVQQPTAPVPQPPPSVQPPIDSHALELQGLRVTADFINPSGPGTWQRATVLPAWSVAGVAGAFWFYTSNNPELSVKILNGGRTTMYIYVGALTDVEWRLSVVSTDGQELYGYHNLAGHRLGLGDTFELKPR